jgi:hypothetical protein
MSSAWFYYRKLNFFIKMFSCLAEFELQFLSPFSWLFSKATSEFVTRPETPVEVYHPWNMKSVVLYLNNYPNPVILHSLDSVRTVCFCCFPNLILKLLFRRDVTFRYLCASICQTNGDKQSEFLVDLISTKWSSSFHNVKAVLDFADIKRFVTGYRRWTMEHRC